jgi:hypothetical protein
MKMRPFAFFLAIGGVLAGVTAMATTPPTPAPGIATVPSASVAAKPIASGSSSAKPTRPPPPQPLESQSIPKEPSSRPTLDEWKNAPPIAVTRRAGEGSVCQTYRVREWLKIKCALYVAAIEQHGGSPENVFFWVGPIVGFDWSTINGGEVMFPMRPGDQRVIEFFRVMPETCFGRQAYPWIIVDELWIEGEPSPTVVIR